MEKRIVLPDYNIPVVLNQATVIYANKLAETSGGWANLPVVSTLIIDAVFRPKHDDTDLRVRLTNIDVPLYTQQDVIVLSVANIVIGYVDTQTSLYYYTTRDIAQSLGQGLPSYYFFAGGVVLTIGLLFFLNENNFMLFVVPLFVSWLAYNLYRRSLNLRLRKSIKAALA